jgi:hypothetical protein
MTLAQWWALLTFAQAAVVLILVGAVVVSLFMLAKHWHRTRREPPLYIPKGSIDPAYQSGQFQILDSMKDKKGITR